MVHKITVSVMLLLQMLSLATSTVYAQPQIQLPSAGFTPDNPLYFLDRMFEGLELWLAGLPAPFGGGAEGRARKMLEIAGERISEMQAMAERDGSQYIPELVIDYHAKMDEVVKTAEALNSAELHELVADATQHHLAVLSEVYERVPDEAKSAITLAKEKAQLGREEAERALGRIP